MKNENSNQPAFATSGAYFSKEDWQSPQTSLTKREYFAAMAMQGMLANSNEQLVETGYDHIAMLATKCADSLLTALSQ